MTGLTFQDRHKLLKIEHARVMHSDNKVLGQHDRINTFPYHFMAILVVCKKQFDRHTAKLPIFAFLINESIRKLEDAKDNHTKKPLKEFANNDKQQAMLSRYRPIKIFLAILIAISCIVTFAILSAFGVLPALFATPVLLPLVFSLVTIGISYRFLSKAYDFHYKLRVLKPNLEDLLSNIYDYIKDNKAEIAQKKIQSLPLEKYKDVLDPNFPNNHDLLNIWYTIHLRLTCKYGADTMTCHQAMTGILELAVSDDHKTQVLHFFINHCTALSKRSIEWTFNFFLSDIKGLHLSIKRQEDRHKSLIKQYVAQIPRDSLMHIGVGLAFFYELKDVVEAIKTTNLDKAFKLFSAVKFDGYTKALFPAASVVYYQLKSLFIALEKFELKEQNYSEETHFSFIREVFYKINDYLNEDLAYLAPLHKKYTDLFEKFYKEITRKHTWDYPNEKCNLMFRKMKHVSPATKKNEEKFTTKSIANTRRARAISEEKIVDIPVIKRRSSAKF